MSNVPFDTTAYDTLSVSAFICEPVLTPNDIDDLKIVYANPVFAQNWSRGRKNQKFIGAFLAGDHIVDEKTVQIMSECSNKPHSISTYMIFANLHVRFEPIILPDPHYIGFLIIHLTIEEEKDSRVRFLDNIRQLGGNAILIKQHDDGRYESLYISSEYAEMMKNTVEETLKLMDGSKYKETTHKEDQHLVTYMLKHHEAPNGGASIQIRKITATGHIVWCNVHFAFIEYLNECYIYITYFDISATKENERRVQAMYEDVRTELESIANDSLISLRLNLTKDVLEDCRGREAYSMDISGKSISENIGNRINFFPLERDRKRFAEQFNSATLLENYQNGNNSITDVFFSKRPGGRKCFVEYNVTLRQEPSSGDVIAFAIEKDYNTEKVNEALYEKVLAEQYDMITYIVDNQYGIVIGDATRITKGSIFPKKSNGAYDEYINEQVIPVVNGSDKEKTELIKALSLEQIERELATKEPYTVNINCKIDGDIFHKRFVFYLVDKEAKFYILLKSDTTELQREQLQRNEQLKSALATVNQANVAKTAFLSRMSHEIRTPMNAIIGLDSIALKEPNLLARTREHLEKIGDSARHLLVLINDILDMSRIESGRMILKNEEFSFKSMLDQINTMIKSQCQERNLHYVFEVRGKIDDYYIGDDMKLKQVLINILGNAVKFTAAGGTITFIVECVVQYEDKSTIRFTIKDTGIGMNKEYLPKIFEAFSQEDIATTNSYGGTGLGMAITKNIVEMMSGDISVDSQKGVGTKFVVSVVLKSSYAIKEHIDVMLPQNLSVLVIDDDIVACEHAKLVLEEVGISADIALSGTDAIEMVKIHHARQTSYNLILVDLRMPHQNGFEVSSAIRNIIGDEAVIIILTAYDWNELEKEAADSGIDAFLDKPLIVSDVLETFSRVFNRKQLNAKSKKAKADLTGRRILLAEDMLVNAEIMKELLHMRDMEVEHAENGQLVVEMFAKSEPHYYDAILMDVRMPIMDGLQATKAIRALDHPDAKTIPIIAMTANAFDEDVQRSLQAGMNAHLSKPVEPEHLYETFSELIK